MPTIIPAHPFFREEASFTPLFRLLDDFDTYSRHAPTRVGQHTRPFNPSFDMTETATSFELHGELPGIEKKNLTIDFADPQTIVIKGSAERHYEAGTPPYGTVSDQSKSHHATVEQAEEGTEEKQEPVVQEGARKEGGTKYWVSERSFGEFSRSFVLPIPINQDAVNASLKDGILKILIPKAEKPASRRIAIN